MEKNVKKITEYFIEKGKDVIENPSGRILPTNDNLTADEIEACRLVENLGNYPHFFVFFCLVNRGIPAHKAIYIPYKISKIINGKDFKSFFALSFDEYRKIFNDFINLRYKNIFAKALYLGIQDIHNKYSDNAANIWNDNPSSKEAVKRFREFWGIGQKISTMAVNILVRQFGIKFKDLKDIDISVDVHVKRVFIRTGILKTEEIQNLTEGKLKKLIIKRAREIYQEYPGILDIEIWRIGKEVCFEIEPKCQICPIEKYCPKRMNFKNNSQKLSQLAESNENNIPENIKFELENETKKTYKVKVLYNKNFSKPDAWEILKSSYPDFKKTTFNSSWSALKKSDGQTPILK